MRKRVLVVLAITIIASCHSAPDEIDDFKKISSNLCQQTLCSQSQQTEAANIKITNEKEIKNFEFKSQGSDTASLSAQFLHHGNNLFFKPQILLGSSLFVTNKPEADKEQKKELTSIVLDSKKNDTTSIEHTNILSEKTNTPTLPPLITPNLPGTAIAQDNSKPPSIQEPATSKEQTEELTLIDLDLKNGTTAIEHTNILSEVPDGPTLSPLVMPDLPETEIVEDESEPPSKEPGPITEVTIEKETVKIPEPPAFMPLNPPEIEIIVSKPQIPTCLMDIKYGISVPCLSPVALFPGTIDIENTVSKKTFIVPESSQKRTFRLPKIPLGLTYNKRVTTSMPYSEGFISTTRFLPSLAVSKIPLQKFIRRQFDQIARKPIPEVIIEKFNRKKVRVIQEPSIPSSSFSAYCAHSIALERVIPNIVESKDISITSSNVGTSLLNFMVTKTL